MSVLIKYTFIQGELGAPGQPGLPWLPQPCCQWPQWPGLATAGAAPRGYRQFHWPQRLLPSSRNGNSSKAGSPLARLVPAGGGCLALGSRGAPEAQRSPRPSFPPLPLWGGSGQCGASSCGQEIGRRQQRGSEKAELSSGINSGALPWRGLCPSPASETEGKGPRAAAPGAQIPWVGTLGSSMCVPKLSVHQIISVTNTAST